MSESLKKQAKTIFATALQKVSEDTQLSVCCEKNMNILLMGFLSGDILALFDKAEGQIADLKEKLQDLQKHFPCPYCGETEYVHYSKRKKMWCCANCNDWIDYPQIVSKKRELEGRLQAIQKHVEKELEIAEKENENLKTDLQTVDKENTPTAYEMTRDSLYFTAGQGTSLKVLAVLLKPKEGEKQ